MKLLKAIGCICVIALLCSTVSAYPEPGSHNGNAEKITQVITGKLTEKHSSNGNYYVILEDGDVKNSVYISAKKYKKAKIGKDYEWKRVMYPDGRECVSFHRI